MHGGPLFSVFPAAQNQPLVRIAYAELIPMTGGFVSCQPDLAHVTNRPFTAPIHPRLTRFCVCLLATAFVRQGKRKVSFRAVQRPGSRVSIRPAGQGTTSGTGLIHPSRATLRLPWFVRSMDQLNPSPTTNRLIQLLHYQEINIFCPLLLSPGTISTSVPCPSLNFRFTCSRSATCADSNW